MFLTSLRNVCGEREGHTRNPDPEIQPFPPRHQQHNHPLTPRRPRQNNAITHDTHSSCNVIQHADAAREPSSSCCCTGSPRVMLLMVLMLRESAGGEERRAGITPNFLREKSPRLKAMLIGSALFIAVLIVLIINETLAVSHPVTGGSFVRLSKFPLLSPRPESGFTDSLQIVGSEGQFGR